MRANRTRKRYQEISSAKILKKFLHVSVTQIDVESIFTRLPLRRRLRPRRILLPPRPWRPGTADTQTLGHSCWTRPKN